MRLAGQPALPGILNIRRPNGTATRRRLRFTELIAGVPKNVRAQNLHTAST
jgi:hypothetical protein